MDRQDNEKGGMEIFIMILFIYVTLTYLDLGDYFM